MMKTTVIMLCMVLFVGCSKQEEVEEPSGLLDEDVPNQTVKKEVPKPNLELEFVYGLERQWGTEASWLNVTNMSRKSITITHVNVNGKTREKWHSPYGPSKDRTAPRLTPGSYSSGSSPGIAPAPPEPKCLPMILETGQSFYFMFSDLGDRGVWAEVKTKDQIYKLDLSR
jgi:hypothetical protein